MTSKKWLVAAVAAVSLTTVAGTSAFALQDGGVGGDGGDGGEGGGAPNLSFDTGDIDVDNDGACDDNDATTDAEARNSCRGFGARGGGGNVTVRAGNGGRGGSGARGGRGGDRFTRRSSGGGFPF